MEGRPDDLRVRLGAEVEGDPDVDKDGECSGRRRSEDIRAASWLTRCKADSSTSKQREENSFKGRSEGSFGFAREW